MDLGVVSRSGQTRPITSSSRNSSQTSQHIRFLRSILHNTRPIGPSLHAWWIRTIEAQRITSQQPHITLTRLDRADLPNEVGPLKFSASFASQQHTQGRSTLTRSGLVHELWQDCYRLIGPATNLTFGKNGRPIGLEAPDRIGRGFVPPFIGFGCQVFTSPFVQGLESILGTS